MKATLPLRALGVRQTLNAGALLTVTKTCLAIGLVETIGARNTSPLVTPLPLRALRRSHAIDARSGEGIAVSHARKIRAQGAAIFRGSERVFARARVAVLTTHEDKRKQQRHKANTHHEVTPVKIRRKVPNPMTRVNKTNGKFSGLRRWSRAER